MKSKRTIPAQVQPVVRGYVTQTVRGFSGPGWELSVTGDAVWVEKMLRKFIPKIQRVTNAL